jgi:hypothetical protein
MRTSPFRSAAYSLHCKTEKFKAILFPRCSHRRCLRTADHRAPVPEAAAVHPNFAKSSSGAHARPSRAKADTPVFDEEGFDPKEEASLQMLETGQHSKVAL